MYRAELVHVIALVRARTCIHEREHAGDEKGGLVMRHGIRPGEKGAGFTVLPLTVAEEKGIGCAVAVPEYAGLPHETPGQGDPVRDGRAALDDEIVRNDIHSDIDRSLRTGYNAAVAQPGCTLDSRTVPDLDIDNVHRIHYLDILADYAHGRSGGLHIFGNQCVERVHKALVMTVQGRDVSFVRGKMLVDGDFSSARLVQHADFRAVSERCLAVGNQVSDILNV